MFPNSGQAQTPQVRPCGLASTKPRTQPRRHPRPHGERAVAVLKAWNLWPSSAAASARPQSRKPSSFAPRRGARSTELRTSHYWYRPCSPIHDDLRKSSGHDHYNGSTGDRLRRRDRRIRTDLLGVANRLAHPRSHRASASTWIGRMPAYDSTQGPGKVVR